MLKTLQKRNQMVKIVLGVMLGLICLAMVITLVPGPVGSIGTRPDAVASVGGQDISVTDVNQMLDKQTRGQSVPKLLRGFYAKQILDQLIFQRLLELEAKRLGLQVTPQQVTDRIKLLLPTVFTGDTWVGKDRYVAEVEQRTGMNVPEFEDWVRQSLLLEKFQQLVTAGISVSPDEVQQDFRRRNEKVKIDYVVVKPGDLAATINPSDTELSGYFQKDAVRYQVAERRAARFALVDLNQLRQKTSVSDAELRAYYNDHIDAYKVQDRVHAEHILFKTIGKTDAEIAEIRKKAEEVLKQAKHGGNFEDLAKKNSEDTTKDKGGDLGWIVHGQTVPEFEHAAFTLPKGSVSYLVKTEYGFHIIKVLDKESAHTKSFDELRLTILSSLVEDKVGALANKISDEMAAAVRRSSSQSLAQVANSLEGTDPLARQCLVMSETSPASVTEPIGELGNTPELHDALFRLQPGEVSLPIRLERGYAVLALGNVEPGHQGKLEEVREKVLADYRHDKSVELARTRAEELAKRVNSGEDFGKAAKALGLEAKTSDPVARTGNIADLSPARQLEAAFGMPVGRSSDPILLNGNWAVYRVAAREEANQNDLAKQKDQIEQDLLQSKRTAAFEAFRSALEARMKQEGKLAINNEVLKRMTSPT